MEEFLIVAGNKAHQYEVTQLCKFINIDIKEFTKTKHDFDVVILASLGGVFGNNSDTIEILRSQVISGGYMIIDDGYVKKGNHLSRRGYEHYKSYEETKKDLTKFNDILQKAISTQNQSLEINNFYTKVLKKRISELTKRFPHIHKGLSDYYNEQLEECQFLENEIEGVLWLLKKIE
jgi:hypothetical protein